MMYNLLYIVIFYTTANNVEYLYGESYVFFIFSRCFMYNIYDSFFIDISSIETRISNYVSQRDLSFTIFQKDRIWKKLIPSISALLIEFLELDKNLIDIDIKKEKIFINAAVELLELNRSYKMNVDIGMLLEFIKCCKSCYVQLAYDSFYEKQIERNLIENVLEFFDNMEVYFCSNWSKVFKKELIKDYKLKNDIMIDTLKKSEERYHLLVEQASDGIFIIDECGNFTEINGAGHIMLQYTYEELLNMNILELIIQEELESANSSLKELNLGKPIISELNLICKNSSLLTVELSAKKLPDGRILGIMRDITQRKIDENNAKLLQEAIAYDKLKTEFFSNISHELRTPVNVVMSALQMCEIFNKENSLDKNKDKLNKYFSIMKQNCYRLIRLVNNLIDITKIDSGYLNLELNNYNIINVIEDIILSVADYIESKGINLIFDTDVEEKVIACDPDKIERIILNLLSNAIKFTKPGGNIYINIYEVSDSLIISVKDTGVGIPFDKQQLVFERFVQVDKSLSRNSEGSGIGLSLVKSLVEMHGGTINLKSQPGKGSEFLIRLPAITLPTYISTNRNNYIAQNNTERINIEFSDIYS